MDVLCVCSPNSCMKMKNTKRASRAKRSSLPCLKLFLPWPLRLRKAVPSGRQFPGPCHRGRRGFPASEVGASGTAINSREGCNRRLLQLFCSQRRPIVVGAGRISLQYGGVSARCARHTWGSLQANKQPGSMQVDEAWNCRFAERQSRFASRMLLEVIPHFTKFHWQQASSSLATLLSALAKQLQQAAFQDLAKV